MGYGLAVAEGLRFGDVDTRVDYHPAELSNPQIYTRTTARIESSQEEIGRLNCIARQTAYRAMQELEKARFIPLEYAALLPVHDFIGGLFGLAARLSADRNGHAPSTRTQL